MRQWWFLLVSTALASCVRKLTVQSGSSRLSSSIQRTGVYEISTPPFPLAQSNDTDGIGVLLNLPDEVNYLTEWDFAFHDDQYRVDYHPIVDVGNILMQLSGHELLTGVEIWQPTRLAVDVIRVMVSNDTDTYWLSYGYFAAANFTDDPYAITDFASVYFDFANPFPATQYNNDTSYSNADVIPIWIPAKYVSIHFIHTVAPREYAIFRMFLHNDTGYYILGAQDETCDPDFVPDSTVLDYSVATTFIFVMLGLMCFLFCSRAKGRQLKYLEDRQLYDEMHMHSEDALRRTHTQIQLGGLSTVSPVRRLQEQGMQREPYVDEFQSGPTEIMSPVDEDGDAIGLPDDDDALDAPVRTGTGAVQLPTTSAHSGGFHQMVDEDEPR